MKYAVFGRETKTPSATRTMSELMLSRYLTRVSLDGAINELWKVERVALRTNHKICVSHLFFILIVHFTNCQHQQKKIFTKSISFFINFADNQSRYRCMYRILFKHRLSVNVSEYHSRRVRRLMLSDA